VRSHTQQSLSKSPSVPPPIVTARTQGPTTLESGMPVFRSYAPEVAQTQQAGQAFHSVGFDSECNTINRQWAEKRGLHRK